MARSIRRARTRTVHPIFYWNYDVNMWIKSAYDAAVCELPPPFRCLVVRGDDAGVVVFQAFPEERSERGRFAGVGVDPDLDGGGADPDIAVDHTDIAERQRRVAKLFQNNGDLQFVS